MQYTELDHLRDKELIVTQIYERLLEELQKFGPIKIEAKKTSVHWCNRFAFAGIYTRKNYINLEFHLNYKLENNRIKKIEQASTNRFHHALKLSSLDEIDDELLFWMKEAYELKK